MVSKVAVARTKVEFINEIEPVQLPADLLNHPALQGVGQMSLTALANHFDVVRVPRGAAIYRSESEAHALFLVSSGAVRTEHCNEQGETIESSFVSGFAILGAGELLSGAQVMSESAIAVEPVIAYALSMNVVKELCRRDIALLSNIAKALAARHTQAIKNEREMLEPAFVRVAHYLTTLSSREGKMVSPDLSMVCTTQDEIAAASGLNARTVSRAMKALQKNGRLYIRRGEYLLRSPLTLAQAFGTDALGV